MSQSTDRVCWRVLVIDDNPSIHRDFDKILGAADTGSSRLASSEAAIFGHHAERPVRPRFRLTHATQGQQAVAFASEALTAGEPFSVAFVDMRMPPGWDGLETIEHLWNVDPRIQVVICSAYSDYNWTDIVARLGHEDRLLIVKKPFDPSEIEQCANALSRKWHNERALSQHIEGLESTVINRTEGLEAANRQLRHLASHDALTGLPNRVLLDDRLSQAIALAERDNHQFAVLWLDLDRFKFVNDSLGHRAGDELLKTVALRLRGSVRSIDTVARIGGDEFVMLLPGPIDALAAADIGRRAIIALTRTTRLGDLDVHISSSVGLAIYPADGRTVDALLAHADAAMYVAKDRGRNNLQAYDPGMRTSSRDAVRVESELHQALARGELELHYQPKVDIDSGEVRSAEALLRWRHPKRGLVPPDEFIPLADECGLLGSIGEWVLKQACRQAKAWQREGLPALRIAVNLAPSQFRLANVVEQIRQALDEAGLNADCLEIELTESAIMSDAEESVAILESISRMGVLVSVDDFGTGYSSMSYLHRFPVDKLKIDRSFIKDVTRRPDDAAIVRAIVSLAHSLHLKVVAEGVETTEQLEFLRSLGCDQYQGYLFSKPLEPERFSALLRRTGLTHHAYGDDWASRTHSKLRPLLFAKTV